ncbi:hypothetical protein [Streptomyces sp. NPDC051162]|uniref:hypothetical protein n=1 Tax=Streptomyces sp. NPDC051162 TaxID=3154747 RepID=UPI00341DD258
MDHITRRAKRLWAVVALGAAALLVVGWATINGTWPWSNGTLPKRSCWSSIDRTLLTDAAPSGDASWKVSERKDQWEDPECTVEKGNWRLSATLMHTPLKTHMWWGLGTVPLGNNLPGMIKPNGDHVDGWLHLPQCPDKLVNVNVSGARAGRSAAADLTARTLLAVGNAQITQCGGKPFPEPKSFDWTRLQPKAVTPDASPCGVTILEEVRRGGRKLSEFGGFDDGPVSRCSALREGETELDLGFFSALVLRDESTLNALSPTGVRATVRVSPGKPLELTSEDLRYDRDAATQLTCGNGADRFVHVFAAGSDSDYSTIKRAVLNKVASGMNCR